MSVDPKGIDAVLHNWGFIRPEHVQYWRDALGHAMDVERVARKGGFSKRRAKLFATALLAAEQHEREHKPA